MSTGAPKAHQILVIDAGAGGWEGDLCDLGALSFTVDNTGGSLLDLSAGAGGPTATVNVFSQSNVRSGPGFAPWNAPLVRPGNFLQIIATTEDNVGDDRDQQVFFGRITACEAATDTPQSTIAGWERSWTVRATNLAVDLGEHPISGTGALTPLESIPARMTRILGRAGSWWPVTPVFHDDEGAPSVVDKIAIINSGDFAATVAAELDRTATSAWCWYCWARDPWRFGYSTAYRSMLRLVPRDSNWRPAPIPGRSHFPFGYAAIWTGTLFDEYEACPLPGWKMALDNANYLYGVHVKPTTDLAAFGATDYDITGDDTFGSREQTFQGWAGSRTGHPAPESGGSPPSGAGDGGWVVATAWADATSIERLSVTGLVWKMSDNQFHNGMKLDVDRLDAIPVLVIPDYDETTPVPRVVPMRVRAVRITAAPGDWRVACELERVDWVTTFSPSSYDFG